MDDDVTKNHVPSTSQELLELLRAGTEQVNAQPDYENLRYALYARKSTTGDERQERSIPDQISDCINKVVVIDSLKVVGKPIEERCSAKDPDIRPKFKQLLEDVKSGKIDGIITWHPDRLSRNMKEAGEIIDLLDKGILKDLRFATSTFENSPTGKMLLGISFVLSKQYSEHLSESVLRGNTRKTEDGIFFDEMKHGYVINGDKLYPDGENFTIVREIFDKRLNGWSNPDIVKWLNKDRANYRIRKRGKEPAPYVWNKDNVGRLLKDPVYAGVLKYGSSHSSLEDYYDFTPVVTVPEFFKVNKIKDFTSVKILSATTAKKRDVTKANLLRGLVYCGHCSKSFASGLTPKVRKDGPIRYYFYRCETDSCEFKNKSIRAHIVLDYAYGFLAEHLFTTQSNYKGFMEDARQEAQIKTKELNSTTMSLTKLLGDKKAEYDRTKDLVAKNPDLKDHYDLKTIKSELDSMSSRYDELLVERKALKNAPATYKQYLELFQDIAVRLRNSDDMAFKDAVLRKFFSNFTIKVTGAGKERRYETTHKLNEPWDGFIKNEDFDCGRGDRT